MADLPIYLAGTNVTLAIPLVDTGGKEISPISVSYRLLDQYGAELSPQALLSEYVPGAKDARVSVPASLNALPADGASRDIRSIELTCTTDCFTTVISKDYIIELSDPLVIGVNSFQGYAQSQLTALEIPKIAGWALSSQDDRVAALIEARVKIVRLNFSFLNSNVNFGQDQLNFVPEGEYQSRYAMANGMFIFNGNLDLLSAQQYKVLPERFKKALRKAQVAEADHILKDGNDTISRRIEGLIEDKIGETRQRYRATAPINSSVCPRAMGYISNFIVSAVKISRA